MTDALSNSTLLTMGSHVLKHQNIFLTPLKKEDITDDIITETDNLSVLLFTLRS